MLTDEEKAAFERGKNIALARWEKDHPDLEGSFRDKFVKAGDSPELAAKKARIAKDGR